MPCNQKKLDDAEAVKSKINGINIDILSEANDQGALYGTITQKQIIDTIRSSKGVEIKSDMIALNPIKSIGEFEIVIRHYEDVKSHIKITVSRKS